MNSKLILTILFASALLWSCGQKQSAESKQLVVEDKPEPANWAERLGYPAGKKVIMLHADDIGMSEEANIAAKKSLLAGHIQSAAAMPPCPQFEDIIAWAIEHPEIDMGLHLTLTSEWKTYRWPSVLPVTDVPGLIDSEGMLWRSVPEVVQNATPEEVAKEVRAQIEKSIALGYRPDHIDTHMGTLYGHPDFALAYLKIAMEYGIPANAIDLSDSLVVARFKQAGYPITDELISFMDTYSLPKVDNFTSAPKAETYEEKKEAFKELIRSLGPGLTEIIFHPAVESEQLKSITNSWQQRVWEAQMFGDADMIQFFKDEGIIFTNWKEIMRRFENK
ncbi:polysaccharide deacetylase family protein [Fulvivirgaceae bacterium BMA12]|uniref:Polysaccharide deacetylase family protein n=1 Tax=Agaribacillus aureus TaxID=3051825 RepID=A0ABT8L8U8_9BACT|nr:polysaccharide deacetylase family protein [Fulvivirgaceae bacterium BMA12]